MESGRFRNSKWYPYAVAACIGVAFYVLLTHLSAVGDVLGRFIGYFKAVIYGCVLSYLMNPLARWFERKPFRGVRSEKARWTLSVLLSVVAMVAALALLLGTLIPQLAQSVATFAGNLHGYIASLTKLLEGSGLPLDGTILAPESLGELSENVMGTVSAFIGENAARILGAAAGAGKNVFTWGIALILSVYLLLAKADIKSGALRLLRALLRDRAEKLVGFFRRCDEILVSFVVDSVVEAVIVGAANAVVMALCGMQYVGLISVLVGVTNLIPTFGPIVGGAIGAFILLLVNPIHALLFVGLTLILQFIDGYIIKPKLFGDALGVSGLLILISVIVCGNMFGFLGMLLAIPAAAILNFTYREYLLPALEKRNP